LHIVYGRGLSSEWPGNGKWEENMTSKIVIGLDGESSGERALSYGKKMAKMIGDCEILVVYVIEWSPYSFHTPEENEQRHKRREEEISMANERVVQPALAGLKDAGIKASGLVRHGDVADTINAVTTGEKAEHIIVSRSSEGGFTTRIFGSSTANLVMSASVPVTVVG
jgi:nucleotide-binding universal stress UspA family protein